MLLMEFLKDRSRGCLCLIFLLFTIITQKWRSFLLLMFLYDRLWQVFSGWQWDRVSCRKKKITKGQYVRSRMKFNSSKCKCVLARTSLLGISIVKWEPFIWKKIESEKDTGVLVDNRVEFKPPMQWGQKKGKSDLKMYWDRYFHRRIVSCSRVIMGLVSLLCERRLGCLGLSQMKEKREYNHCL